MIDINDIKVSDIEFADEVYNLALEAKEFLTNQKWCKKVKRVLFDRGWGYLLCIFYCEIEPKGEGVDNAVWIIVGDIPSAYIDVESAKDGEEALKCYVDIMEDWVNTIKKGKSVDDCYPVKVLPTPENATMLETRLRLIKEEMLP